MESVQRDALPRVGTEPVSFAIQLRCSIAAYRTFLRHSIMIISECTIKNFPEQ